MSATVSTNAASVGGGAFPAIYPGVSQIVTTTGTSAQSSAFGAATTLVRVTCDQDVYLAFGTSPTATSSGLFLGAKTVEYFGVAPASKIAGLQVSSGGSLYITEGA